MKFRKSRLENLRSRIEEGLSNKGEGCFVETLKSKKICISEKITEINDYNMTKAVSALMPQVGENGYLSTLGMITVFDNEEFSDESYLELYVCAKKGQDQLPEGRYISRYHMGGYENLQKTYKELYAYAKQNHLSTEKKFYCEMVVGDWAVKSPDDYIMKVFVKVLEQARRSAQERV